MAALGLAHVTFAADDADVTGTWEVITSYAGGIPSTAGLENGEFVMVCGVAGSLDSALQAATGGLAKWLAQRYELNAAEIATLLANSVRYDVAEVVDPQINVVAKIGKDVLAQLPRPQGQ